MRKVSKRITKECMSKPTSFESLQRMMDEVNHLSCKPGPEFKKVAVGTILDEDKSVRWNREEVERIREEYTEEVIDIDGQRASVLVSRYNGKLLRVIPNDELSRNSGLSREELLKKL